MGFNAQNLLRQVLSSGQTGSRHQSRSGRDAHRQGGRSAADDLMGQLKGLGGGAAAGTALSMLLGGRRRRGRGMIGRGGTMALGALAYRAYTEWQARQQPRADAGEVRTLDRVSGSEAEEHSRAVLKAVIAAAKADGHIDTAERQAIEAEFDKISDEPEGRRWLIEELGKRLDPAEVARAAGSDDVVASEMYLASRLVVDAENFMERAYLDELARCLGLDAQLQARLDQEAEQALKE